MCHSAGTCPPTCGGSQKLDGKGALRCSFLSFRQVFFPPAPSHFSLPIHLCRLLFRDALKRLKVRGVAAPGPRLFDVHEHNCVVTSSFPAVASWLCCMLFTFKEPRRYSCSYLPPSFALLFSGRVAVWLCSLTQKLLSDCFAPTWLRTWVLVVRL